MNVNWTLAPWQICCIASLLVLISSWLSVITWINREKKLYDQSNEKPNGYRYSTDNGNSHKKEKELYDKWGLQIPPDQPEKHANGL